MIQRMDSSMNMQPRSFMAQTVTRSESYSALDQMATTETLREKAETTYESKPVNLAGLSGKNAPQPAPKYDKGIAEAWLKAAEEAVSKISGEKRAKAAAEKAAAQQREEEAKKKAAQDAQLAAEAEERRRSGAICAAVWWQWIWSCAHSPHGRTAADAGFRPSANSDGGLLA